MGQITAQPLSHVAATEGNSGATYCVKPFVRQIEKGEAVIGLPERGVFVAVPLEALEILDLLAAGSNLDQIADRIKESGSEEIDLIDFVENLGNRGFLEPAGNPPRQPLPGSKVKRHLSSFGISKAVAARMFGPVFLSLSAIVLALACFAIANDSTILPRFGDLYIPNLLPSLFPWLLVSSIVAVFFHELGHIVAARAVGVRSRLGLGNRLWIVVAESDLTGLWAVPRNKRFLPLLAGPLIDLVSVSTLILVLAAEKNGLVELSPGIVVFIRALVVGYSFALIWQTYFFLRTDLYYVLANAFSCKNLMEDTSSYLREIVARVLPGLGFGRNLRDLSMVPPREMRIVIGFSFIWLGGRVVAIAMLALVQLPLLWKYLVHFAEVAGRDRAGMTFEGAALLLSLALLVAGFSLWILEIRRKRRSA